jgi:archaetidylinositol phosphate synthase
MTVSRAAGRGRPARELVVAAFFGPVAQVLALAVVPLRVPPSALVLTNAAAGIVAAVALGRGALVLAALLLQLKTILDNADGRLAWASGRVSLLGRYLDTEADLAVNVLLFAALGYVTGQPWLALAAFCALTFVLSVDFNLSELYRETRLEAANVPQASGGRVERMLERVYRTIHAPQDRLIRAVSAARLARIVRDEPDPGRRHAATLAYHDRLVVGVLANLGLSTQLVVLGICLVLGTPALYLWLVLATLALLPLLQLRRERRARLALAR